ncbi:site-specific integrase [Alteromonas lipotrueiana]|uniref:site-specific integrase n=1 Tax=Alteromonas lipotrueiana TaxID=2803815 RepID=UPI001C4945BB|nr:site-specific integrase [Alteromonas lipotrueiana]
MAHANTVYLANQSVDCYEYLYAEAKRLNHDYEPLPYEIETFFGQKVTIRNSDGRLKSSIRLINLGSRTANFRLSDKYSKYDYLSYIAIQCWLDTAITRSPSMIMHYAYGLPVLQHISLSDEALLNEAVFAKEIASQLSRLILENKQNQSVWLSIRAFANYAIENCYWGFDETLVFKLAETKIKNHGQKARVSLLDHEYGPFTRSEIGEITQALQNDDVNIHERVMIKLAMQFGLRPIQLALLRESDIYYDASKLGWYINIPRVKGKVSQLRRNQNNFVLRELSDDLANEIGELIKQDAVRSLTHPKGTPLPRPLFKREQVDKELIVDDKLTEYAWHKNSNALTHKFISLGKRLNIFSRHVKDDNGDPTLLRISCYRFRYTLGTRMVLEGKTPEELAIALDHGSTNSVQHYFRYNRDLIDFIDDTFDSSIVLENAVMRWKGFLIDENDSSVGGRLIRTSSIANLGKCLKQTSCEFHPTVSCYGCGKFRPFKNADHQAQLKVIEAEREFVQQHSSGPVRHQLDEALQGAIEICEAQNLLRVYGFNG